MMPPKWKSWAFTFGLVLAGCASPEPDLPPFEVVDSAGVEVVISHYPEGFQSPWTLSEEPILRIGKGRVEDPYLFRTIRSAVRLSDGSVVVLDSGARDLRRFDQRGQHIVTFGGIGDGPGEFRSVQGGIGRLGDTLLVLDSDGAIARFDPGGRLLSQIPTHGLRAGDGSRNGRWEGVLPTGELWGSRFIRQPRPQEHQVHRSPFQVVVSDAHHTEVTTVGEFFGLAQFYFGDLGGYVPVLMTHTVTNRNPVGLLVADNETFTIDLFGTHGGHLRRMKYPGGLSEPGPGREKELEQVLIEWTEALVESSPGESIEMYRSWLDELPPPRVWPGFNWVVGDEDGYIWVFEYLPTDRLLPTYGIEPEGTRIALVFHPDGHLLGSVDAPARLTPFEIGQDYILGMVRDDLGVNELVLYGLAGR